MGASAQSHYAGQRSHGATPLWMTHKAGARFIGAGEGAKGSLPSVSWLVHGWDEAECARGCVRRSLSRSP